MKPKNEISGSPKNLRQPARDHLDEQAARAQCAPIESDAQKQLQELHVHQIELEMQNAELQQARTNSDVNLARYTDLYDFAPIGYFTLDCDGSILEVNLTGATLLRTERSRLSGQPLSNFIAPERQPEFRNFMRKVMLGQGKEIHEMGFLNAENEPLIAHIEATMDASGKACRLVMLDITERKQTEEALRYSREMLRHMVSHQEHVKEDERKRIAREIHDDLGQNLLALRLDIAMLHERTSQHHPRLHRKTAAALEQIDTTLKAVRTAINNLRPTVLDLGLNAAIEWLVKDFQQRNGIRCTLIMDETEFALDDERATALFRILQESFNNVLRHANADHVRVEVRSDGASIFMTIGDNGVGFFPGCRRKANSFGLLGITERVNALHGRLDIDSCQDKGTCLSISLPLKSSGAD
ncbi:PAS domain-containing sensor histidine kinase [Noviherbaspirillum sedimenti]|uniref:PAS domain-containing sensor histidine kinase n=1 Tax=Noviherbaspirillum sedimenti TaxID=2320865 RepID=A0A3A3GD91_9BURK|nr:PAS domain-containing sensor histidine kinase [Noviherbaspirillum sedimenti]RJG00196.1 PAS domain-containing sensor histidine kinase [Noviherbaspirillum sedimenti]